MKSNLFLLLPPRMEKPAHLALQDALENAKRTREKLEAKQRQDMNIFKQNFRMSVFTLL